MTLSISFQTLTTPPPFAFGYTFKLTFEERLLVGFELEYLNREDVTQEELEAEGFTENDNFSWAGELGKPWLDRLQSKIGAVKLVDISKEVDSWLFMRIEQDQKTIQGHPVDPMEWEFILQELMQAVLEKAGREAPFSLNLLHVSDQNKKLYTLTGSFETLKATINGKSVEWEALTTLMQIIYAFDVDQQVEKSPKKIGIWLDEDVSGHYQRLLQASNKKYKIEEIIRLVSK